MSSTPELEAEPQIVEEKVEIVNELKEENHEIKEELKQDLQEKDLDKSDKVILEVDQEKNKEVDKSEDLVNEIQSKGEEDKDETLQDVSDKVVLIGEGDDAKIEENNVEHLHSEDKEVESHDKEVKIQEKGEIEVKDLKNPEKDPECKSDPLPINHEPEINQDLPDPPPSIPEDQTPPNPDLPEIESVPLFPKDIAENLYQICPNPTPEHPPSQPGLGPGSAISPKPIHPEIANHEEPQIPEPNPSILPSAHLTSEQDSKLTPSPTGEHPTKRDQYLSQLSSIPKEEHEAFFKSNPEVQLAIEFNYEFDSKQQLVNLETGGGFKFTNQTEYERLGKIVQRCIQKMMTDKYGLLRVQIPLNQNPNSPHSYIYISPNFNNPEKQHAKALLLIQGAGAVRPGIWARSVCINESLKTGSMNSFLSFANKHGFEVIIFNPNKCRNKGRPIEKNSSLESHGKYIWKTFIRDNSPKDLYIVGHSCGGLSTVSLMNLFWDEFKERVKGIAFTDAVHGYSGFDNEKIEFLRRRAVDWVASRLRLDEKTGKSKPIVFVSSGHSRHEYTTGYARKSIKRFFLQIDEKNPYL